MRSDFATKLDGQANVQTKTTGYPAFSRNVAISQGDRSASEDPPYSFADGDLLYNRIGLGLPFIKTSLWAMEPRQRYFRHKPLLSPVFQQSASSMSLAIDNAPGSYEFQLYSNAMRAIANSFASIPDLSTDNLPIIGNLQLPSPAGLYVTWRASAVDSDCRRIDGGPWSFVPVVSGLGLNTSYLGIDRQWRYNLDAEGLMYGAQGVTNSYFGYPVVGHPADHFDRTPFEALCSINENSQHIGGENPQTETSASCSFEYGSFQLHESARDFLAAEIVPQSGNRSIDLGVEPRHEQYFDHSGIRPARESDGVSCSTQSTRASDYIGRTRLAIRYLPVKGGGGSRSTRFSFCSAALIRHSLRAFRLGNCFSIAQRRFSMFSGVQIPLAESFLAILSLP